MTILDKQKESHLKDYIEVLVRRRDAAIAFFVSVVVIVTIGSFIMKPVYRATVTLLVDPVSPNVLTTSGMVALQGEDYLSYREYFQSQLQIVDCYALGKKVFEDFKLGQTKEYSKAKEPVRSFMKTIRINPVPDTRLIKLSVDNEDPQLAADIANRISELYVMRNLYYISKNELSNLLKNEYLKLETKASEYAKVYKEGHPEMIRLRKEMADMNKRMNDEKRSVYDYDRIEEYIKDDSGSTLAGFKANNISIQDPAEKPIEPVRPKKRLNVLLSIILGALGGIGLAFFLEYLDDTVKSGDDLQALGWPLIGSIRDIGNVEHLSDLEKDLLVHLKPNDPVSEAYRLIRTNVLLSATEEHPLRCIVITSPGPQEGKTTTLCNLGIAMAQDNKKVLLIDADMRKPRVHEAFKVANDIGLSDYLCGQAEFDKVVHKTDIHDLYLVKGGSHPPNPSELLGSHRLKELVAAAKHKFDFVLFDSPPIAVVTDAAIISQATDGIIVVAECGKTPKRTLPAIDGILKNTKAWLIGAVANKVPAASAHGQYYYYYGKKQK